ncbi:MAG TPA: hypothetical protein VGT41_06330 [Candidatus Babeliales bacterium]|nr:hypothetical protein [Candidatus Babeliales bacterium]
MTFRKYSLIFMTFFVFQSIAVLAGAQKHNAPVIDEELLAWAEAANKEVDKYVSTLTTEERAKFNKEVEELTHALETMSEEQLSEFFKDLAGIEGLEDELTALPEPTPTTPAPTTPIVVTPKPVDRTEQAITLLNNIITRTERFLRTVQRISELSGSMASWVEKDKAGNLPNDLTWAAFKTKIETFDKKVTSLKDRDSLTQSYYYIDALIKDEKTYKALSTLSENLTTAEPKVQAPQALTALTTSSRDAMKSVLGSLSDAIYKEQLEKSIDAIIAQAKPTTKAVTSKPAEPKKDTSNKPTPTAPATTTGQNKELTKITDVISSAAKDVQTVVSQTKAKDVKEFVTRIVTQTSSIKDTVTVMQTLETATLSIEQAQRLFKKLSKAQKEPAAREVHAMINDKKLLDIAEGTAAIAIKTDTPDIILALKDLGEAINVLNELK